MIDKRDIVNFIFVISFPIYGIGSYISASRSPSFGYIVSILPHFSILVFYVIDLLYRKEFHIRVNVWFTLMIIFIASSVVSLFVAVNRNLPENNISLTIARSLLLIIPFQSFVVIHLYNNEEKTLSHLAFLSLSLLLFINLFGFFVLGLTNEIHSIEGRVNFPYLDGTYSGSCLLAILSLMLLYYFQAAKENVLMLLGWFMYFSMNLVLMFLINSRLTILVFLIVIILLSFKVIARSKSVYWISIFTLPILLSTSLIIYQVLTLPVFVSILQRVDVVDITTFNGRAFLWQDAIDWLLYDQRGLLFGNGYRGHYFLGLIANVAELWNEKDLHHLHLHSTSLEILVCQGVAGYLIFLVLFYQMFEYYRNAFRHKASQGVFFAIVMFLLFIAQVDTFLYLESLGFVIFSWLLAIVVIQKKSANVR